MRDDYLWNKSGEPDPEIERLERVLAPLAHNQLSPDFLHKVRTFPGRGRRITGQRFAAVAAMLVVGVAVTWMFSIRPDASWAVANLQGGPRVGSDVIGKTGRLPVGESLSTDSNSRARIDVGKIGQVQVEPGTRLRLIAAKTSEHRLALDRGTIHAFITAPPGLFFVNTPSAVAVDLGCAFTLEVDDTGAALLRVIVGWVGFEWQGRESFIPAMAACRTRPGQGPGTPYYIDADPDLQSAVRRYDEQSLVVDLQTVLDKARPRDGLTLWHLIARTSGADKARIVDRMMVLVPLPEGVTREGILAGNRTMYDRWWTALGLGDTDWWRWWTNKRPLQVK